jgi:hypothetical protein
MKQQLKQRIKLLASAMFVLLASAAVAQRDGGIPPQAISKEIQKFAMRKMVFVPARVVAGPYLFTSKSVQTIGRPTSETRSYSRVQMTTLPSHVISKGVARMQYERANSK